MPRNGPATSLTAIEAREKDAGQREEVQRRDGTAAEIRERPIVRRRRHRVGGGERRLASLVLGPEGDGDHRLTPDVLHLVHARCVAERGGDGARVAVDEPVLPVVVVHREAAPLHEVAPHRGHGLFGEQVALETDRAAPGEQDERVGEREEDEVEACVRAFEKCTSVIDMCRDPRIVVRPVRVDTSTEIEDLGIDLDGIDVGGSHLESDGDVVAGARPDDEHPLGGAGSMPEALVGKCVLRVVAQSTLDATRHLVGDAVDVDVDAELVALEVDLLVNDPVVGRPRDLAGRKISNEERDEGSARKENAPPRPEQRDEERDKHEAPDEWRHPDESECGERRYPGETSEDVEAVGLERLQLAEAASDELRGPTDAQGHGGEEKWQGYPHGRPRGLAIAEVDDLVASPVDLDRNERDECEHDGQHRCRQQRQIATLVARQEADPDAEERPEEHEIREVAEVNDLRAQLTDQHELQEEHEGAPEEHADASRPDTGERPLSRALRCFGMGDHAHAVLG